MHNRDRLGVLAAGVVVVAALTAIGAVGPQLGSPTYLLLVAVANVGYVVALGLALRSTAELPTRFVAACLLLAVGFRAPLWATAPGRDVFRYVWDARVQAAGYNPYVVVPSDPRFDRLHTAETRRMNHPDLPTPYPPGAQLFFRIASRFADGAHALKLTLGVCDVLLWLVLWQLIAAVGARRGWMLAYAWNPLVILETAAEGHLDVAGALCLAASALLLVRGRGLGSALCFALAVAIKPLPVVLIPLFWRRVRLRDAVAGGTLFLLLYLPYMRGGVVPLGSMGTFIDEFRFNYTLFSLTEAWLGPRGATVIAIAAGVLVAAVLQARWGPGRGGTWAWPMAVSLVASPVVYPWYLVWLAPFANGKAILPLLAWTVSIPSTYVVWYRSQFGSPWAVPLGVRAFEFGSVLAVAAGLALFNRGFATRHEPPHRSSIPSVNGRRSP